MSKLQYRGHNHFREVITNAENVTNNQVKSDGAPPPAAAYSHAIKANGMVYVSGQIPYTPENKPLENASVADEAERIIQNVKSILEASNSDLNHVVKNTVFLTDMKGQFAEFNSVYVKYFSEHRPARSCVAVKELPLGVRMEMECIALEKDSSKL